MASSATVLKEFLVSIGFDLDEQKMKRFDAFMARAEKGFKTLAIEGAGAAVVLGASITKIAESINQLYYVGQRTNTSVAGLKAFTYGAEQVGVSADAATGALESMSAALRTSPGLKGMLKSFWHIDADKQSGVKTLMQLIDHLRHMPYYQGYQYAAQFGIDEKTFFQLTKNYDELKKKEDERTAQIKKSGVDYQKSAEQLHAFVNRLGQLGARFSDISVIVAKDFLPTANKLVDWANKALDVFLSLDKATGGWSSKLLAVVAALGGVITALGVIKGLKTVLNIGKLLGGGAEVAGAAAGAVGGGEVVVGAGGIVAGLAAGLAAFVGPVVLAITGAHYLKKLTKGTWWDTDSPSAPGKGGTGLKDQISGLTGFIARMEGHARNGYGIYKDQAGIATAGFGHRVLPGENLGGLDKGGALALLARDMTSALNEVKKAVKVKLNDHQLTALTDFVFNAGKGGFERSTLLKDINKGDFAGAIAEFARWNKIHQNGAVLVSPGLTRRRATEAAEFSRPVTVNQKTDIHVSGVGDPATTAKKVASKQGQVNADIVRNMGGVIQ